MKITLDSIANRHVKYLQQIQSVLLIQKNYTYLQKIQSIVGIIRVYR